MAKGLFSRLPKGALTIAKELARHILRRPVVGVAVAGRTTDGRWLLIRRADTGTWALPGGTVEWGETLAASYPRELEEEAGVVASTFERVTGVFSRPDRDPRFHAITVVVRCTIQAPVKDPSNPLEILEARLFADDELPDLGTMGMAEMLACARDGAPFHFE
ncbi:MAG: NUDIX hydrolase [Myxococcales bacterium]|nr:NUDIX hydrolase [Myxococcales bacterium]